MKRDWRDSKAGLVVGAAVFILILAPKPWLTPWQNVGVDAVLIPFLLWLNAPALGRTIGRGPKIMGIVLAGLLVTGLWGTGASAGTVRMSDVRIAYETAKSKAAVSDRRTLPGSSSSPAGRESRSFEGCAQSQGVSCARRAAWTA